MKCAGWRVSHKGTADVRATLAVAHKVGQTFLSAGICADRNVCATLKAECLLLETRN